MFRTLIRQAVGLCIGAALAAFVVAPAPVQAGQMTITGLNCSSLVVGGSNPNWTVACSSMTCGLSLTSGTPAPGNTITMRADCDSGANAWVFDTPTAGCHTPTQVLGGSTATVSESSPMNCTYRVNATAPGSLTGQATLPVTWSNGTPPAPTGCTESANQTSFTTAGGTINLSASCNTPASGIAWSWTRNGVAGWSALQNPSDVLPANGTSSAVNYTYQAKACNGADSFGGANCVTITPQISASVAGIGGGSIDCASKTGLGNQVSGNTVVVDMDWANPAQLLPSFGQNDSLVVRITPTTTANNARSRIYGAENATTSTSRYATLSAQACDFRLSGTGLLGAASSSTPSIQFYVGHNNNNFFYPELTVGTTYYFNVQTSAGGCSTCNMSIWLDKGN